MPNIRDSLKFLEKHKAKFGFSDYDIRLRDLRGVDGEMVASAEPNWLERRLTITLYKQYWDHEDWQNVLIHEFVHSLVARMQAEIDAKMERLQYYEEEKVCNILTDAYMELLRK